jgi:hypothetical protein
MMQIKEKESQNKSKYELLSKGLKLKDFFKPEESRFKDNSTQINLFEEFSSKAKINQIEFNKDIAREKESVKQINKSKENDIQYFQNLPNFSKKQIFPFSTNGEINLNHKKDILDIDNNNNINIEKEIIYLRPKNFRQINQNLEITNMNFDYNVATKERIIHFYRNIPNNYFFNYDEKLKDKVKDNEKVYDKANDEVNDIDKDKENLNSTYNTISESEDLSYKEFNIFYHMLVKFIGKMKNFSFNILENNNEEFLCEFCLFAEINTEKYIKYRIKFYKSIDIDYFDYIPIENLIKEENLFDNEYEVLKQDIAIFFKRLLRFKIDN